MPVKRKPIASDKRKLITHAGVYLAAIWVVAVLPFIALLVEYREITLCPDTSLGWFIATLYSSFFLYIRSPSRNGHGCPSASAYDGLFADSSQTDASIVSRFLRATR
jgi:hypothetical protein